ncbi:MAG: PDZ domain-containing protein [Candidatus Edwardsbacteria bacterium]
MLTQQHKPTLLLILLSLIVTIFSAQTIFAKEIVEKFQTIQPFKPGRTFELKNKVGEVSINSWDKSQVKIEALKTAQSKEILSEIKIKIESKDTSALQIITEYPKESELNNAQVSYNIWLPNQANLEIEEGVGDVTVRKIEGKVRVKCGTGDVSFQEVEGRMGVELGVGDIEVVWSSPEMIIKDSEFTVGVGNLKIKIPKKISATFLLETVIGEIETTLPVEKILPHKTEIKLGSAEAKLRFSTGVGDIKISGEISPGSLIFPAEEKIKQGWLGVVTKDLSPALKRALNVDYGVLVTEVVEDSPAQKAKIEVGDVLLEIDGIRIENRDDLAEIVENRPGKNVTILILRNGLRESLTTVLGEREENPYAGHYKLPNLRVPEEFKRNLKEWHEGWEEVFEKIRQQMEDLRQELERKLKEREKI